MTPAGYSSLRTFDEWDVLENAADSIKPNAFEKYFELRRLLQSKRPDDHPAFRSLFSSYFGLHAAGLTDEFRNRYFERLFEFSDSGSSDPYTALLREFFEIPRRQGGRSLQVSFTSKLVAIHDDSRPIYDRHVCNFFGLSVPAVGNLAFRIDRFLNHLERVEGQYKVWARDPRFESLRARLILKQPLMQDCHASRLCDFLVWTIGDSKLLCDK